MWAIGDGGVWSLEELVELFALLAREPARTHQHAKSHAKAQSHGDEPDDLCTMQPFDPGTIQAVEQREHSE